MKMRFIFCLVIISASLGCRSSSDFVTAKSPEAEVLQGATRAFAKMRIEGNLPGLAPAEQGRLETLPVTSIQYPQIVTIRVETEMEPASAHFYTLDKVSRGSHWKLLKAWQKNTKTGKEIDLMNHGT